MAFEERLREYVEIGCSVDRRHSSLNKSFKLPAEHQAKFENLLATLDSAAAALSGFGDSEGTARPIYNTSGWSCLMRWISNDIAVLEMLKGLLRISG